MSLGHLSFLILRPLPAPTAVSLEIGGVSLLKSATKLSELPAYLRAGAAKEVKPVLSLAGLAPFAPSPGGPGPDADLFPLRHGTMAIGIAVDILGCTGTLEDRAATLNRIIQVAVELKDSMGDLYSFSAIMKALEMPQVNVHLLCEAPWASVCLVLFRVVCKPVLSKPQA